MGYFTSFAALGAFVFWLYAGAAWLTNRHHSPALRGNETRNYCIGASLVTVLFLLLWLLD